MREIFKRRQSTLPLFSLISFLLFTVISCEGFNFADIDFNGDIRSQIQTDLSVTYSFYEYPLLTANHKDKVFITGKTVYEGDYPEFEHETELLVGWNYFPDGTSDSNTIPSNFNINDKQYVTSFVAGNKTQCLSAVWKKKCVVNFVSNWPGINIETQILPEGDCLVEPQVEWKQGHYRFWGWYTDEAFTNYWNFSTPVTDSMTLYGRWQEVRTIKYYKNDGTDEYREQDYGVDWTNTIDGCMWERSGYGFVGWSTNKNANTSGITHWAGEQFEPLVDIPNDLTLYAVWSTDIVTITYIDSTGTFSNKTAKYGRGAHVQVGMALNDEGYWYTGLYNIWQIEGLNITGYSASSTRPSTCEYNSDGWYDYNGDGSISYSSPDKNFITIENNMTLYVYWTGITYSLRYIYYDEYGYEQSINDPDGNYWWTVEWNERAVAPTPEPSVPGKIFEGWYRATWVDDGSGMGTGTWVAGSTPFDFTMRFNSTNLNGMYDITLLAKFADAGHAGAGTISFSQVGESDITVGVDETVANKVSFVAPLYAGAGVYYHWYLNDNLQEDKTGYTATFDYSTWAPGIYDLLLVCCDGTYEYSYQGKIQKN